MGGRHHEPKSDLGCCQSCCQAETWFTQDVFLCLESRSHGSCPLTVSRQRKGDFGQSGTNCVMNTGACRLVGQVLRALSVPLGPQSSGLCQTNSATRWPVEALHASFLSLWGLVMPAPCFSFCFRCLQVTFISSLNLSHTYTLVRKMVLGDTCFL